MLHSTTRKYTPSNIIWCSTLLHAGKPLSDFCHMLLWLDPIRVRQGSVVLIGAGVNLPDVVTLSSAILTSFQVWISREFWCSCDYNFSVFASLYKLLNLFIIHCMCTFLLHAFWLALKISHMKKHVSYDISGVNVGFLGLYTWVLVL